MKFDLNNKGGVVAYLGTVKDKKEMAIRKEELKLRLLLMTDL